jgi:hypothetical protein
LELLELARNAAMIAIDKGVVQLYTGSHFFGDVTNIEELIIDLGRPR